jgi:hypothetical protein
MTFGMITRAVPLRRGERQYIGLRPMQTYRELEELAVMCAHNARTTTTAAITIELWKMAKEYQNKAAQLGTPPDIGPPPSATNCFPNLT